MAAHKTFGSGDERRFFSPQESIEKRHRRCCRIINGDTLEIIGTADQTIADTNDEYRWIELEPHQLELILSTSLDSSSGFGNPIQVPIVSNLD